MKGDVCTAYVYKARTGRVNGGCGYLGLAGLARLISGEEISPYLYFSQLSILSMISGSIPKAGRLQPNPPPTRETGGVAFLHFPELAFRYGELKSGLLTCGLNLLFGFFHVWRLWCDHPRVDQAIRVYDIQFRGRAACAGGPRLGPRRANVQEESDLT